MAYERETVSNGIEIDILTGMITNSDYLREVGGMINPRYFKIDYVRKIVQWVLDYNKRFKAAPFKDIQSIFVAESAKLKPAEAEIIQQFLQELSEDYQEGDPFNKDYWVDKTILFCKDRALEHLQKTIEGFRLQGEIEKAEEAVRGFNKVVQSLSQWVNPFDDEEIKQTFIEDESDKLYKLPGILGDLIGWLKRGWFISIMGPTKRGKSFYAWEFAYHALTAKLKVVIFSFEMNKTTNKKRIYGRLTAMAAEGGEYAYPVFDCLHNQDGSCERPDRANKIRLLEPDDSFPKYSPNSPYKVCCVCRGTKDFMPGTWWAMQIQKNNMTPDDVIKKAKWFKRMYGSNLRLIAPPSFSVGFDFIGASLDQLEYEEGFVADVILIDSLDITEPEVMDELQDENRKWIKAKQTAGVRHALVMNCNQGNRGADDVKTMKKKHTGGTIKKLQNVDAEFTLNQTEEEKERGVMRFEYLVGRHDEATEKGQVLVLQQLKLGQPFIDSEWEKRKRR